MEHHSCADDLAHCFSTAIQSLHTSICSRTSFCTSAGKCERMHAGNTATPYACGLALRIGTLATWDKHSRLCEAHGCVQSCSVINFIAKNFERRQQQMLSYFRDPCIKFD